MVRDTRRRPYRNIGALATVQAAACFQGKNPSLMCKSSLF
jgi:hypothetical protein